MPPSSHTHPQLEPIEPVQAANAIAVHQSLLTSQQLPNPHIANRGLACARSPIRSCKADSSLARLSRYQWGSPKLPRRQARAQLTEASHEITGPVPGDGRGLRLISQSLRQHMLVEREIGYEPLNRLFASSTCRSRGSPLTARCAYSFFKRRRVANQRRAADRHLPPGCHFQLAEWHHGRFFGKFRPLH